MLVRLLASLIRKETSEKELGLLMAGYSLEEARRELQMEEVGGSVE